MDALVGVIDRLAATWLTAYRQAAAEGLKHYGTVGPRTDDPHCSAATALSGSALPALYGGWRLAPAVTRWSASKRAALATFEQGLRLGLDPGAAARAVRKARYRAGLNLGIPRELQHRLQVWVLDDTTRSRFIELEMTARLISELRFKLSCVVRTDSPRGPPAAVYLLFAPRCGISEPAGLRKLQEPLTDDEVCLLTRYQDDLIYDLRSRAAVARVHLDVKTVDLINLTLARRAALDEPHVNH